MIKRTLLISNPYYLKTREEQLVLVDKRKEEVTTPIEDIGYLVLDHPQITISVPTVQKLVENNVAVIYCDQKHLPSSLLLPLNAHYLPNARLRHQLSATEPLKKQLWKQTTQRKIKNQGRLLKMMGKNEAPLTRWAKEVKSGDPENREALASRYYWGKVFNDHLDYFIRDRYGDPPNHWLNYGYAILRAATARALVGSGLLTVLGIHHHNQYNPFCLADDIMEPYRPLVDWAVLELLEKGNPMEEIQVADKQHLLQILTRDVEINKQISPLMIALNKTAASLAQCFEGKRKQIIYPALPQ